MSVASEQYDSRLQFDDPCKNVNPLSFQTPDAPGSPVSGLPLVLPIGHSIHIVLLESWSVDDANRCVTPPEK